MIHRFALLLGGIAAVGILAFSLLRGDRPALSAADQTDAAPAPALDPTAAPAREVVDTVYVAAPKKPKVVHVTRRAPTPTRRPAARNTRPTIQKRAAGGGDDGHEREGGERGGDD
jgi:hypothetical protein